jgi:AraC family transcriptional regulator, transcriptional activator of pobA
MSKNEIIRLKTIAEFHKYRGIPGPEHPLISLVDVKTLRNFERGQTFAMDFYKVSLKRANNVRMIYGQQQYDFDAGLMAFMSPGQVFRIEVTDEKHIDHSGWILLIHPDFLWNTPLAKTIRQYEYFDYAVNEALFLSEKEEALIIGILEQIGQEYHSNIDRFSQNVIIAHLEVLFTYAERFYERQFITRKITNHEILGRLEEVLSSSLKAEKGLPTVHDLAKALNLSPNYLSGLLKVHTGQTAQQHIHNKLIEKAKERLTTTSLSVSEIAYELGFEHSQSFSKLFKSKTGVSALEFRHAFVKES